MDSNEIVGVEGGKAVVVMAVSKPKMRNLNLDANSFGEAGCEEIYQILDNAGKSDIMEPFEDDEEPDGEPDQEEEPEPEQEEKIETLKTPSSIFGGAGSTSLFGTPSGDKQNTSIFSNTSAANTSIFGGAIAAPSTASPSIFGGSAPANASKSIFGGAADGKTPLFGATSSDTSGPKATSLFGSPATSDANPASGSNTTPLGTGKSLFGSIAANAAKPGGWAFGAAAAAAPANESSKADTPLFGSKDLPTFGSVGAGNTSGSIFGSAAKPDSSFSFAGAGAPVFGSASKANAADGDEADGEDAEHDPHFEPIIPLPELVQVKTGEEDEETLFKYRAKVFRFSPETKEWKERGLGDIKILKHAQRQTFRVLQRRDQIHKIACNHLISTEMELKPLSSSETALCWYAMDYAEDEAKMEHLAVRFKTAETKNEFKKIFEECQAKLRERGTDGSPSKDNSADAPESASTVVTRAKTVSNGD